MTKPGFTHDQSLARRIQRFYVDNRYELLTWPDIQTKFDCTKQQADAAIAYLRKSKGVRLEVVSVIRVKEEAPR